MARHSRTGVEGWLILALAFMSLLTFWYVKGLLRTPGAVDLSPMPEEEFSKNEGLGLSNEQIPVDYELDTKNVLLLLSEYKTPELLTWEVSTTTYSNGKSRTLHGIYTKKLEDFDIKISENNVTVKQVIKSKEDVTLSYAGNGIYKTTYSENYRPTVLLGMADVEFVAGLSEKNIVEASMDSLDGHEVLYVGYRTEQFNMMEKYWISLDYGLPLKVESYIGNELTYSADTISIS